MVQKRKTSTKEDIKEALIQLLSEERFDNISISKLCKRARINRGTFYPTTKINIRWLKV